MEFLSKSGLSFFKSLLDLYFATKSYVNKAISTNTGKFWGTFNDLADLQEITGSNGDYAYVIVPDDYSTSYDRYKWQTNEWVYEYTVGGEAFDDDQWAAINSGITASDKARLDEISENIGSESISDMRSDIDANASEIEEINEELGDIDTALANKANVDGYYESMAVGQADNLKGQVLIPNDAAFRTSGGSEAVDTGLAHLQNVKGNTVSWNQLVSNGDFRYGMSGFSKFGKVNVTVSNGILTAQLQQNASNPCYVRLEYSFLKTHKYLISVEARVSSGTNTSYGVGFYMESYASISTIERINTTFERTSVICSDMSNVEHIIIGRLRVDYTEGNAVEVKSVNLFDLTLIYGAGNEPATVEQFEADYEKWFGKPLAYEPYNAGELIPAKTTALKTTGFNQWDEEWEVGGISNQTGENVERVDAFRAKGFIKVLPNTDYYFAIIGTGSSNYHLQFYDSDKNFLFSKANFGNNIFNTSVASFVRFYAYMPNPKYDNNVCIHLVWSGTRNIEYEPYESHTLQLPITTLTGKLNGAGEAVMVFPDGMKKAGSVQDEIYVSGGKTYAVKRVGSVDLGSLSWTVNNPAASLYCMRSEIISNMKKPNNDSEIPNIVCVLYIANGFLSTVYNSEDKVVGIRVDNSSLEVNDRNYTDPATFKSAMQGVMLYYELATPLIYELDDFTLPATFRVNDWGTEEQLHADGVASVPAILNSLYAVNAVDTIRRLPQNYISQESMDNFLAQLGAAMGGTWTKSFNTTTNEFEFSFVQSASLMSVSNNEETNNEEA